MRGKRAAATRGKRAIGGDDALGGHLQYPGGTVRTSISTVLETTERQSGISDGQNDGVDADHPGFE